MTMVRTLSKSAATNPSQRFKACPVCDSFGIATGEHTVERVAADWDKEEMGDVIDVD